VCIWNLTTGEARKIPVAGGRKNQINCVSFNPDAITFASGGDDGVLRIWDAASGHQLQALHVSDLGIFGLDFSPDGRTLACSGNDYTIHLWDVRPIVPLRQYLQLYRFDGLDLTPLPAVNLYGDSGFRAQTRQRLRRAND
jgi:WD40 repeat protein